MAVAVIGGCSPVPVDPAPGATIDAAPAHPTAITGKAVNSRAKLSPFLKNGAQHFRDKKNPSLKLVRVLFADGPRFRDVKNIIARLPGARLAPIRREAFDILHSARVFLPDTALSQLAASPAVRWIEPVSNAAEDDSTLVVQSASGVDHLGPGQGARFPLGPYNLTGQGITVGHWESAALPLVDHVDLAGRVTVEEPIDPDAGPGDGVRYVGDHATQVLGVIGGSGVNFPRAEGMAPHARLTAWTAAGGDDPQEILLAALSTGGQGEPVHIDIANVTAGRGGGWLHRGEIHRPTRFGMYTGLSADYDGIVVATGLPIVKSAGNSRLRRWGGRVQPENGLVPRPSCGEAAPPFDAPEVFRNCIGPVGSAKNVITVGAVNEVGQLASFSSVGPALDGRLKPDVVAVGDITLPPRRTDRRILMLAAIGQDGRTDRRATRRGGGTSFSTPAVSGMIALLLEQANRQNIRLDAAMIKALLIHTARDVVDRRRQAFRGPDYATGWGLVQVRQAVDRLKNPAGPLVWRREIAPPDITTGYGDRFQVAPGAGPLKVTLVWTDPAADPAEHSASPRLVHDLDLRLAAPDGRVYRPWLLDPDNVLLPARMDGGDDNLNNVEQVFVRDPAPGIWRLIVTAKELSGPQTFAIVADNPLFSASGR